MSERLDQLGKEAPPETTSQAIQATVRGMDITDEDCRRIAACLDVHVRPVYWKAANGKGPTKADIERKLGQESLEWCDRMADLFGATATPTKPGPKAPKKKPGRQV